MSGSGASILGYGNITPNANVNPQMVNVDGSTYAANFSSNQIPTSAHSLPEPSSNVIAASGTWTGVGGKRKSRRKNIGRLYKMKSKSGKRHTRHAKSMKKHSKTGRKHVRVRVGGKKRSMRKRSRGARKGRVGRKSRRTRRVRKMRGGYAQFSSNVPNTPGYGLAGSPVAPGMSAIANPPVYNRYMDCADNYNHYAATQR